MIEAERIKKTEEIRQIIIDKSSVNIFSEYKPIVKVAHEISYKSKEPIDRIVIIKKSWLPYLVLIGFSFQIAFFYYIGAIIAIIFWVVGVLLLLTIRHVVSDTIDQICLDCVGVHIGDTAIFWSNIFEVYITETPYAKSRRAYLYIATSDFELKSFDISDYGYRNLGHIIKHYQSVYISPAPITTE